MKFAGSPQAQNGANLTAHSQPSAKNSANLTSEQNLNALSFAKLNLLPIAGSSRLAVGASNFEAKAANFGRSNLNQTPANADKNGGANLNSAVNFSAQNASNLSAANFDPNFLIKLANLVAKYGLNERKTAQNEVLDVATGKLALEQINLIFAICPSISLSSMRARS